MKNRKLLVIFVIFIVMLACMRCARADYVDSSTESVEITITPTPTITSTPTPTPSPVPDYSSITDRLDNLYDLIFDSKIHILISIWALTGLSVGYVIIKDTFR